MYLLKFLIASICLFNSLDSTAITYTNSDSRHKLILNDQWQESILGNMFYDNEFVLKNKGTGNILLVQIMPYDFLYGKHTTKAEESWIRSVFTIINSLYAEEVLLPPEEEITDVRKLVTKNAEGVLIESKYKENPSDYFIWLGQIGKFNVIIKVISKTDSAAFDVSGLPSLLDSIKISSIPPIRKSEPSISPYLYSFYKPLNMSLASDSDTNSDYQYMNLAYEEDSIYLSSYHISSQCTGVKAQEEVLTQSALLNYELKNTYFKGFIEYRNKRYYVTSGNYEIESSKYQVMSLVVNGSKCQHVLSYVAEDGDPMVNNFFNFIDGFVLKEDKEKFIDDQLSEIQIEKYAKLLAAIGSSYYSLKSYSKSREFFNESYNLFQDEDVFYYLLSVNYKMENFATGMELIDKHNPEYTGIQRFEQWKAWYLSYLHKPKESAAVFQNYLTNEYTSDSDFFEYLDQLLLIKDYDRFLLMTEKFQNKVEDQTQLKYRVAEVLIEQGDKAKAIQYIQELLTDEEMIKNYQFDLYDFLADLQDYEFLRDFITARLNNGYQSALLYNYLGDSQNMLGDYESALQSMKKAHDLSPNNSIITSYYESLLAKVGKSDNSEIEEVIPIVELPQEIWNKIKGLNPASKNDSYEYLYSVQAFRHKKNEKNKRTLYERIKVNNASGIAKNKTLKFGYNQQYENAYINYFRILDAEGRKIADLDKSTIYITTNEDGMTADGDKLINVPVPSLTPGAQIEFAVTRQNNKPDTSQSLIDELFVSSVSNHYKAIVFQGDLKNVKIIKSEKIKEQKISENLAYWEYYDLPNYKKTPYLPDYEEIFPWLKISTVYESWTELGDEYLSDIKTKINHQFDMSQVQGITDSTEYNERIKSLSKYVQDRISYQAIEFGLRAYIPNTADTTLKNNYGDCKDHAVLLHDLLNSSGIKAELALVNSGNDVFPDFPSFGVFNHMIVYLPEVNGGVFIDATDKDADINLINPPLGLEGYSALVLEENNSHLVKIPLPEARFNVLKIQRRVDSDKSRFYYSELAEVNGHFAAALRNYLKKIETDELDSRISSWLNDYYSDLDLESISYKNLYNNSEPLIMEFRFSQDKSYARIGLPVFMERFAMEFSKSPHRKWMFEYKLPFEVVSLTETEDKSGIRFKKGKYSNKSELLNWSIEADKNKIKFKSTVFANKLPGSKYQELYNQSKDGYRRLESLISY